MRCFVEDNRIKLRREGIFFCLDGSKRSHVWEKLYDFLTVQCRNFDVPLKIWLLSWDKELERIPDAGFLSSNRFAQRGRFITPFVENVCPTLQKKEYDLLIVTSGTIYDFEDWYDELNSRFNTIHVLSQTELEQKPQIQVEEELIELLFTAEIDSVILSFEDSLPYEFPNGCSIAIEAGKSILTKEYHTRLADLGIKTYGVSEKARCTVKTSTCKAEISFNNTLPKVVSLENELNDYTRKILLASINCYKRGEFTHYCPLCQKEHNFSKALLCNRHKSPTRIFSKEALILNELEVARKEDSRYAIFWQKDKMFNWQVFANPVVPIKDKAFIVVPDEGNVILVTIFDELEICEFEEIHKGLFLDEDKELYVLALSQ